MGGLCKSAKCLANTVLEAIASQAFSYKHFFKFTKHLAVFCPNFVK